MIDTFTDENGNTFVRISNDFEKIFCVKNMGYLINSSDEISCVLRGHLMLEECLNLWIGKILDHDILSAGSFNFKSKLDIAKKLGLCPDICEAMTEINKIRNKLSHKIGYEVQDSEIDLIKQKVDKIQTNQEVAKCELFPTVKEGLSETNNKVVWESNWETSNNTGKLAIIFHVFAIKILIWFQAKFIELGIKYSI